MGEVEGGGKEGRGEEGEEGASEKREERGGEGEIEGE